jgi:urease accessory protein
LTQNSGFPLRHEGEGAGDEGYLHALDQLASASKTPLESYEASTKIGRRLLNSVAALLTSPTLDFYSAEVRAGRCAGHQAIAFGLACAAIDLPVKETLMAFAYNTINGQIAAAVKLLAMGQTQAQAL